MIRGRETKGDLMGLGFRVPGQGFNGFRVCGLGLSHPQHLGPAAVRASGTGAS